MSIDALLEDFALLDSWEDRYGLLIDMGAQLSPLPDALRTEANKVRGCASQVWLVTAARAGGAGAQSTPRLTFQGDSDAHIVRGLIAVLFQLYQDKTPAEILATDAADAFRRLGLGEHLSPQRANGFHAMVECIRADAAALAAPGGAAAGPQSAAAL